MPVPACWLRTGAGVPGLLCCSQALVRVGLKPRGLCWEQAEDGPGGPGPLMVEALGAATPQQHGLLPLDPGPRGCPGCCNAFCIKPACAGGWKSSPFFLQGVLALKSVNRQRIKYADPATVAKISDASFSDKAYIPLKSCLIMLVTELFAWGDFDSA